MPKILKVCVSEDLPLMQVRDQNTVYFVYDKMKIYLGRDFYSDPFCIVEAMPDDAIEGMLYITLDGEMKTKIDGHEIDIGSIESDDQKQYLLQAGTVYFMKAEYRYLDLQTRTLQLPFQNGKYELSMNLMKDIPIDENTIIRFNVEKGRFEIGTGTGVDDESIGILVDQLVGVDTNSIHTEISGSRIKSDVIVSTEEGNIIKVTPYGIYATVQNVVGSEELSQLIDSYNAYKNTLSVYLDELNERVAAAEDKVSDTTLADKIIQTLQDYDAAITTLMENYDQVTQALAELRENAKNHTDDSFEHAMDSMTAYVEDILEAWDDLPGGLDQDAPENYMTEAEFVIQSMVLEALHAEFIQKKEIESGDSNVVDIVFYINHDEGSIVPASPGSYPSYPSVINFTAERGSQVGKIRVTIQSPDKDPINNYYYRPTYQQLIYNYNIDGASFTPWDGVSEITHASGEPVTIVEVTPSGQVVRMGMKESVLSRSDTLGVDEMPVLKVVCKEATQLDHVQLEVIPTANSGNTYVYGKATSIPMYHEIVGSEYMDWDGVSEIPMFEDKELYSIIEIDSERRAVRYGMVYMDKTDELLKSLVLQSDYGDYPYYTKMHVEPTLSGDGASYYYQQADTPTLPLLDTHVGAGWLSWDGTSDILMSFDKYLTIVEVDKYNNVKKAGSIYPKINNTLNPMVAYDTDNYLKNKLAGAALTGRERYYYVYNPLTEVVTHLQYNEPVPGSYTKDTGAGFSIEAGDKIAVIESVVGSNKVERFGSVDATISYCATLTFDVAVNANNNIEISNISSIPNLDQKYAVVLMVSDLDKVVLNTEVQDGSDDYIYWDGLSEIEVADPTAISYIGVYLVEDEKAIKYGRTAVS